MSNLEHTTSWQQIQQGVKEAERLIVNKNYNLVMVKARQTLECMVRCMAEKACLVEGDLSDTIDQLYEGGWINKTTKDNYHTIRILGNKAVHENDNTAYNANQAYQLLTQEVHAFLMMAALPEGADPENIFRRRPGTYWTEGKPEACICWKPCGRQSACPGAENPDRTFRLQLRTAKSKCQTEKTQGSITAVLSVASSDSAPGGDPSDRSDPDDPSRKG